MTNPMKNPIGQPIDTEFYGPPIGLTKREYFAALAMQGLLTADTACDWTYAKLAQYAAEQADALIAELSK